MIDELTTLRKIEVIDGDLNDLVVSYHCHLQMKEKGILLDNIDYTKDDRKVARRGRGCPYSKQG